MALDVKRAFLYAPVEREVYIELPPEDQDPNNGDMVGMLKRAMYGTRDAPLSWQRYLAEHLKTLGFEAGKANPCALYNREYDMQLIFHVDDMLVTGEAAALTWFRDEFSKAFECTGSILGPDAGQERQISFLNRLITWSNESISYEADPRHAQAVLKELGMQECTGVETPGVREESSSGAEDGVLPTDKQALFRRVIFILNYMAPVVCGKRDCEGHGSSNQQNGACRQKDSEVFKEEANMPLFLLLAASPRDGNGIYR